MTDDTAQQPASQLDSHDGDEPSELIKVVFDDLFAPYYHPTDIDACGLHEKHTPQCYACRHAKWSNIVKSELIQRFDSLRAVQELKAYVDRMATRRAVEAQKALLERLKAEADDHYNGYGEVVSVEVIAAELATLERQQLGKEDEL